MMNDKDEQKMEPVETAEEGIAEEVAEEEKKSEKSEWELQYKRALADYQNLQRRTQEQKGEWIRLANKDLLLKFLPILDTLVLTVKHFQDKSLQLVIEQFLKVLQEEGVTRIKTIGEEFDPRTMECVTTQTGETGKVLEETRAGYLLGDIVLRPAQVTVGA